MPVVRFEHVAKSLPHGFWLRRKPVLRDVTLSVEQGEVYGFLGPNGAGKTTSMKCLLGLLTPDAGTLEIFGKPGSEPSARQGLGYLPEQPYFYPHLTGRELVDYFGRLFGIPRPERVRRTERLLETVGMAAKADLPIRQYSKGMLQRIGLAQALINDPKLVILDEPMSGLDPVGRREVKDIILELKARGTTVFFSSHILADAEALCDRVGLLFNGRILRESTLADLLEERVRYWEAACEEILPGDLPFQPAAEQGGRLYYRFEEAKTLDRWVDLVRRAGGRIVLVSPYRLTLEEYFVDTVRGRPERTDPEREPEVSGRRGEAEAGGAHGSAASGTAAGGER